MRAHVILADNRRRFGRQGFSAWRVDQALPRNGHTGKYADFAGISALGGALIPRDLNLPDNATSRMPELKETVDV